MPQVQMPDGQMVSMPDKVTAEQLTQIKSKVGTTSAGRRVPRGQSRTAPAELPVIPFMDRAVLSRMNGPQEQEAFLKRKYGDDAVAQDKGGFVVTVGGKKMRATSGFLAEVAGAAPQYALAAGGAVLGSEVGPAGTAAGAGAGMALGRGIEEAAKSATGLQRKSGFEVAKDIAGDFVAGTVGEIAGGAAAKVAGRVVRGPLPAWFTGATPESKKMMARSLTGESEGTIKEAQRMRGKDFKGRPPLGAAMPSMKFLQREIKKAELLTGKDTGTTRKNISYVKDEATKILDKAGITKGDKYDTLGRMIDVRAALSYTESGRIIQQAARHVIGDGNKKVDAYLSELIGEHVTPEQAIHKLLEPGEADRLVKVFNAFGSKYAVPVQAAQQQALKQVLARTLAASEKDGGEALEKAFGVFTKGQQRILFPDGLDKDIALLARKMKFSFPSPKDLSMPGWTTGSQMEKAFYVRWYHQGISAVTRAVLQHPRLLRRLALGYRGGRVQAEAANRAMISIFQNGIMEQLEPKEAPADESADTGR